MVMCDPPSLIARTFTELPFESQAKTFNVAINAAPLSISDCFGLIIKSVLIVFGHSNFSLCSPLQLRQFLTVHVVFLQFRLKHFTQMPSSFSLLSLRTSDKVLKLAQSNS